MDKRRLLLLKTMLLSTSRINKLKHSKDKKTKNKALAALIAMAFLYIMVIGYSVLVCVGFGEMGMSESIPEIFVVSVSSLALVFTFFKVNGYLFAFKEYDMLLSLPFEVEAIASDKFLYMYLNSFPWYLSISVAMLGTYGVYAKPKFIVYVLWMILTFFVPIIPMLVAAFIGFLIARISVGFKNKNAIQTIITFGFVLLCFSLQYIIDAVAKSGKTEMILQNVSDSIKGGGKYYLPIVWFGYAIKNQNYIDFLLLIVITVVCFEVVFWVVGKNYRQINSLLKSHVASKDYSMTAQKKHDVVSAIVFKEFKRFTGSQSYLINCGIGELLTLILGVVCIFVDFDTIIKIITKGAPFDSAIVTPAIPLIVYFLIGMVATTAVSPSLEGKNYWIIQSLPIEKKVIYQGKMKFNLCLMCPFAVFTTVCMSISAGVSFGILITNIIEIVALCVLSTTWGCVCGIKHMKLDWENEIEVVKQGANVAIYLFPNMFGSMIAVVGVIFLGLKFDHFIISFAIIAVVLLLSWINYKKAIKLADKT